jgi:tRNA threonylcarbamoyladenosine biosynthesis protein TsaB
MTTILAIDTATEACSVALYHNGAVQARHEVIPRQHNRRLFSMLREVMPQGVAGATALDALAYSAGPGSFTGLRITASAVQGIAYARSLPALPVSTLVCQAQSALRQGLVGSDQVVLSLLDARIDEIYWSLVRFVDGRAVEQQGPVVCRPAELKPAELPAQLVAVGSGLRHEDLFPETLRERLAGRVPDCLPHAEDLLPTALHCLQRGQTQTAEQVAPRYVRDEVQWKKLPQQGRAPK